MTLMSREDQLAYSMNSLLDSFSLTNKIMSGRSVVCRRETGMTYPSSTDGTTIKFSVENAPLPNSVENVAILTGLNYHELCHVIYTPFKGKFSELLLEAQKHRGYSTIHQTANIMEDARIELQFIASYPSAQDYFTLIVNMFILAKLKRSNATGVYPLVIGRTYLDREVRSAITGAAIYTPQQKRVLRKAFASYMSLDPKNSSEVPKAIMLIKRVHKLINPQDSHNSETCESAVAMGVNSKGQKSVTTPDAPITSITDKDLETDDEQDEGEAGGGQPQDESPEAGDDAESDSSGSDDSNGSDSNGAGTSAGQSDKELIEQIASLMEQERQSIMSSPQVVNETRELLRSIKGLPNTAKSSNTATTPVPQVYRRMAAKVKDEFRQLHDALDGQWKTHTSEGRIRSDVFGKDLASLDLDTIYDKWQEDRSDEASIEIAVLVDTSGSMSSTITNSGGNRTSLATAAGMASWSIKSAVSAVGGKCSIIGFDGYANLLSGIDDRLSPNNAPHIAPNGGTAPGLALQMARQQLSVSDAKYKAVIILTDGEWSWETWPMLSTNNKTIDAGDEIEKLYRGDVAVSIFGIGGFSSTEVPNRVGNYATIGTVNDPMDIVPLIRSYIRSITRKAARNV